MQFNIKNSIGILEQTPQILKELLKNLPIELTHQNEGANTWSPFHVVAHLIHGEKTDWIPRTLIMLSDSENKKFEPFNMTAHFQNSDGKTIHELLTNFEILRKENIKILKSFYLSEENLKQKGIHPEFGEVTLKQHLATWTVHDLGHIAQISRVLAKNYTEEVGPWNKYLSILK